MPPIISLNPSRYITSYYGTRKRHHGLPEQRTISPLIHLVDPSDYFRNISHVPNAVPSLEDIPERPTVQAVTSDHSRQVCLKPF
jgi:hypothetical protein